MSENSKIKEKINKRKVRGMLLIEQGIEPEQVKPKTWIIPSSKGKKTYTVTQCKTNRHWKCTCKDFELQGIPCKHIQAVKIWSRFQNRFKQTNLNIKQTIKIETPEKANECKFCHSEHIIKYGKQNGKQQYMCKDCNRKFVNNVDFENMKYNPKIIALTLDLYFQGMSLRKIKQHLKQFYGLKLSHMSVYRWIEKYIGIMSEYVDQIKPSIGEVWHTDEMMVNIHGHWQYMWNVIDERTRFQLASVVSKERKVRDARMVFKRAKNNSGGRKPKYMVTDGLHAYKRAVNKEFHTNDLSTEHLHNVGLQHHPNNNHVERLHGGIRQREKTMRGLKNEQSPITEGHRLYYNFIKPHQALDGKTPSEEAGITIEGDNKWLALMKTSLAYQKYKHK